MLWPTSWTKGATVKDFLVWALGFFIVIPFMAFFPFAVLWFVEGSVSELEFESTAGVLLFLAPLYLIELGVLGWLVNRFNLD